MKKNFFIIVLFVLALALPAKSESYSSDPKTFISEVVDETKKVLVETNSEEFKKKKLSEIAVKAVDIRGIGFYTLGKYRKGLSDDELKKYIALFEVYFLKSFISRLIAYSEPKINVLNVEVLNPKYTIVKSLLLATDLKPEVKINWRVYTKNPYKPLIRDLIIEGVSLARMQKEEFASVLESNNGDITKLFTTLKKFNETH